jgi:hypothetical protein
MEGFLISDKEVDVVREKLLKCYEEIIKAFDSHDIKRMSVLIYDDFMKHFSSVLISRVMLDGGCIKKEVEEFLNCIRLDFTAVIKRMGGELN